MSVRVELIYDRDCPNVPDTRRNLAKALVQAGLPARWTEWEARSQDSPEYASRYGSPTILVNSRDIAGLGPGDQGRCCRLYEAAEGAAGAPPVEIIASGIRRQLRSTRWLPSVSVLPGVGFALLPKLLCPACWPAYAALVSSLGLGFLLSSGYLFMLVATFLGIAVAGLAYRARARRGYGPSILGAVGSVAALLGKFVWDVKASVYGGLAVLLLASIWNIWPYGRSGLTSNPKTSQKESCHECETSY